MTDGPPPFKPPTRPEQLDFSEFHPLFHSLWRCRGYPGGRRRHLAYKWESQWSSHVRRFWRCTLLHRHDYQKWWRNDLHAGWILSGETCSDCYKDKPETSPPDGVIPRSPQ